MPPKLDDTFTRSITPLVFSTSSAPGVSDTPKTLADCCGTTASICIQDEWVGTEKSNNVATNETITVGQGASNTYTYSTGTDLLSTYDLYKILGVPQTITTVDIDTMNDEFARSVLRVNKKEEKDMKTEVKKDPFPGYSYIHSKLEPERIVFNPPATVVFWKDGTKTVVKCSPGEAYSPYFGFLAALGKRVFGTNSELNRIVNKNAEKDEKLEEKIVKWNTSCLKLPDHKAKNPKKEPKKK